MRRTLTVVLLVGAVCLLGITSVLAGGPYNLDEYEKITGKKIEKFSEAPMLRVRVATGELPPVEERLPENPLVMIPWEETGKYGGTLNYIESMPGSDISLRHYNEAEFLEIGPSSVDHFYSGPGGSIRPGTLEAWEISEDAKVFTLRIRKGLKWSDGVPVTTEDVRYVVEDILMNKDVTPRLPVWAEWGGEPMELEVIDDRTFRLKFVKPYGTFLETEIRRKRWHRLMRPKHYLKKFHIRYTPLEKLEPLMKEKGYSKDEWGRFYNFMDMWDRPSFTVRQPDVMNYPTLDPWRVVSNPNPGEFILERNPYYYKIDPAGNQLPYMDRLHRRRIQDQAVVNMKILTGEVDAHFQQLRLSDYPLFMEGREKGDYEIITLRPFVSQMLIYPLNLTPEDPVLRKIIQDVRFRQALSLALNREEIKESIFLGFGRPAQVTVWPGSVFYEEEFEKAYVEYDPERANKLLDEMGLEWDKNHEYRLRPDGKRLTVPLTFYEVTPPAIPGAELASEYWGEIGVYVPVKFVSGQIFWQIFEANKDYAIGLWWCCSAGPTGRWFGNFDHYFMWSKWFRTDGKEGIEPLPAAKRAYECYKTVLSTSSEEERIKAGREVMRIQAENLWSIGTVAAVKYPFIYSKRLGNIAVGEEKDYYIPTVADHAEQWFFKQ